jgi:hypothetical protein
MRSGKQLLLESSSASPLPRTGNRFVDEHSGSCSIISCCSPCCPIKSLSSWSSCRSPALRSCGSYGTCFSCSITLRPLHRLVERGLRAFVVRPSPYLCGNCVWCSNSCSIISCCSSSCPIKSLSSWSTCRSRASRSCGSSGMCSSCSINSLSSSSSCRTRALHSCRASNSLSCGN